MFYITLLINEIYILKTYFNSQYKTLKPNNKCKTYVYKIFGVEHIKHGTTLETTVHTKHNYKSL